MKNNKIRVRHDPTRPKWRLEPKCHDAGTSADFGKCEQTDTHTQDSCFINVDWIIIHRQQDLFCWGNGWRHKPFRTVCWARLGDWAVAENATNAHPKICYIFFSHWRQGLCFRWVGSQLAPRILTVCKKEMSVGSNHLLGVFWNQVHGNWVIVRVTLSTDIYLIRSCVIYSDQAQLQLWNKKLYYFLTIN